MKTSMKLALCVAILFGLSGSAHALCYTNSGQYMFTVSGNDPANPSTDLSAFESQIEQWFSDQGTPTDFNLSFYAKTDAPSATGTEGAGSMDVSYGHGGKSGTWNSGGPVEFYSVKAGNQYALYWLGSPASSGTWSTEDLTVGKGNTPSISHISTWASNQSPDVAPVPEPTTVLLLGSGLFGMGILGRKSWKR